MSAIGKGPGKWEIGNGKSGEQLPLRPPAFPISHFPLPISIHDRSNANHASRSDPTARKSGFSSDSFVL